MFRKKIIFICTIVCLLFLFYLQFQVVSKRNTYIPEKSQCILILGHSLEDGELPGSWLTKRLETGLALYQDGYAQYIVVSGGKGKADQFPVADSMKTWLLEQGVPEQVILAERESKNTYENFEFSSEIIKKTIPSENEGSKSNVSVLVVTNDFHMYRSMLIADGFFTKPSGFGATVDFDMNKLLAYIKEPFSIIKDKLLLLF